MNKLKVLNKLETFSDDLFEETGLSLNIVYDENEIVGEYWIIGDAYSGGITVKEGYEVIELSEYNPNGKHKK